MTTFLIMEISTCLVGGYLSYVLRRRQIRRYESEDAHLGPLKKGMVAGRGKPPSRPPSVAELTGIAPSYTGERTAVEHQEWMRGE